MEKGPPERPFQATVVGHCAARLSHAGRMDGEDLVAPVWERGLGPTGIEEGGRSAAGVSVARVLAPELRDGRGGAAPRRSCRA
eukprot:2295025-Pleurochrysis_carterae.AAC.3